MVARLLSKHTLCLLVMMIISILSVKITMEDLETGAFEYKITENKGRDIPSTAQSLHKQARSKGKKGDYEGAIKTLKAAMKLAPRWEYPYYDLAYTYLLQKDYVQALRYYTTVDKLFDKGFFTTKTALWSLNHELKTELLPKGIYSDYLSIEFIEDKSEQLDGYTKLAKLYPEYGPSWAKIATLSSDQEQKQKAIDNGLKLIDTDIGIDAETKGMLYIQQALIYSNNDDNDKAKRTLADLIMSADSTFHNENMAKFFLKSLTVKNKKKKKRKKENKDEL